MVRMHGQNAKLSRLHNRALALKLIIQSGSASRKELADRMGLTKAAMTKIAEELISLGLIAETSALPGENRLGRRPIPLAVVSGTFRILTLQLGRHRLRSYLTDAGARILRAWETPSRKVLECAKGPGWPLAEHAETIIRETGVDARHFFAVAISAPGPVKAGGRGRPPLTRTRYRHPYMWEDLGGILASRLGCPVFAENDSNLMALGEHWFGLGKGCSNFVFYGIGEGIGAAAIIDDMLYRGHNNVVAEVGHITVNLEGATCPCGNRGCLELYASFERLREGYLELRGLKPRSYGDDLAAVFSDYDSGEPAVRRLVETHSEVVANGAVSLANMFSPEKIIVGAYDGGWTRLAPYVEQMRVSVRNRAFSIIEEAITIEESGLGPDIMAFGGTALVMSELLADRRRVG